MRPIGNLPDEAQARVFGDFLIGSGIKNEVEHDADGSWSVWVMDEDQLSSAQTWLEKFRANPHAAEFQKTAATAAKIRKAEAQDLAEYSRRVRTRKSLFPSFGGSGVGILTFALIVICAIVAVYSKLGYDHEWLRKFILADPQNPDRSFLPEVRAGEYWRLITPIFIHFGPLHLIFNLMWLYQLGCIIEARGSSLTLTALVLVTGVLPMLAQYLVTGPGFVGGMSGVIYGLAGYAWMRGKYDRTSGLYLDSQSVTILLVWLVVCFTGAVGPVANSAHVAGLITGVVWGRVSAWFATRKPE
jgi:GlpG protein